MGSHRRHRTRAGGITAAGRDPFGAGDTLTPIPIITGDLQAGRDALTGHPGGGTHVLVDGDRSRRNRNGATGELGAPTVEAELFGAGDLVTGQVKRAGHPAALLVAGSGDGASTVVGRVGSPGRGLNAELLPGLAACQRIGEIGIGCAGRTAGLGHLV